MKNIFLLASILSSSSVFAGTTYHCVFDHTDISETGQYDINQKFSLKLNESKVFNFPNASRKTIVVKLTKEKKELAPYSLNFTVYRNYQNDQEGELSWEDVKLANVDSLAGASVALTELGKIISIFSMGEYHDDNSMYSLHCVKSVKSK